jgi:hypothetical protein
VKPPVRWSHLKKFAQSAHHYEASVNGAREETAAMRIGSAVDALLFNSARVATFEGKRIGAKWEAFQAENEGALLVNERERDTALGCVESLRSDRYKWALAYLEGEHRAEISWSYLGRECLSHPDVINEALQFESDLKTGVTSNPEHFPRQARKMLYLSQHAFYRLAIEAGRGWTPRDHYNVVVEQKFPHVVSVFRLTPRALLKGQKEVRLWMEALLNCEGTDEWPGYAQCVMPLDDDDYYGDDDSGELDDDEPTHAQLMEQIG